MAIEEIYRHPEDYDLELAARDVDDEPFWLDLLRRERPAQVLEVGCGTGRLTLPLAREGALHGWRVVGLDPEPAMLARAEQRLRAESAAIQQTVRFVWGDARTLDLCERFDVVLLPFGVAHHLTSLDDQIAAWRAVRRHLMPRGLFAVDVVAPDLPQLAAAIDGGPRAVDMEVTAADGRRLRRSDAFSYSPAAQRATHAYEYEVEAAGVFQRAYRSEFAMHVYYPRELELLFRLTGFRLEQLLGSYQGEPFDDAARLMIALGRG